MAKLQIFAWAMYDLANTIFSALFVTFFYPFYVKQFLGGTELEVGFVFSVSMLLVALLVPMMGAMSDALGRRMPFIIFFTALCCVFTYLAGLPYLPAALVFGLLANFSYHAALTVYNALQTRISGPKDYGFVSGLGVGIGYIGTLFALFMAWLILSRLGWETIEGTITMFIVTALMFGLGSMFTFVGIKEPGIRSRKSFMMLWRESRASLRNTMAGIRGNTDLLHLLFGMFAYTNAITAVIVFLFLYARSAFSLDVKSFMVVYAVFSVAAAFGSFVFARRIDTIGPKRILVGCGWAWIFTILLLIGVPLFALAPQSGSLMGRFADPVFIAFLVSGSIGGAAMGIVWSASRPMLIALAPKGKLGQFFGLLEFMNKFSGVIGPMLFGALATFMGYGWALSSLLVFFGWGLWHFCRISDVKPSRNRS
jgi:UMF1 family MFS transporter